MASTDIKVFGRTCLQCCFTLLLHPGCFCLALFLTGLVIARHAIVTHYSTPEAPLTEDVRTKQLHVLTIAAVIIPGCYHGLWVFRGTGHMHHVFGQRRTKYTYTTTRIWFVQLSVSTTWGGSTLV